MRVSQAISWLRPAAGAFALFALCSSAHCAQEPSHSAELDAMIVKEAKRHGVPEDLVRRVVMRESRYNPRARNRSFWGLMQISYPTAKSMGFKGTPEELLNPVVNLTYAVPYLANAFVIAGKRQDAAVRLYAHGYYEAAKHRGLLGILRTAESTPVAGFHDDGSPPVFAAQASPGLFGTLFGSPETTTQAAPDAGSPDVPAQVAVVPVRTAPAPAALPSSETSNKDPRKGGVTVFGRGEQGVERLAAYGGAADATPPTRRVSARHAHKSTAFASLDAPASAQAYAASANETTATAASQGAISQALTDAGSFAPQQAGGTDAATAPQQTASAPAGVDDAAPVAPTKRRKPAAKKRAVATAHETPVGPVAALRP